jgi:hypothetical protein
MQSLGVQLMASIIKGDTETGERLKGQICERSFCRSTSFGSSPALSVRVSRDPNLVALVTNFTISTGLKFKLGLTYEKRP